MGSPATSSMFRFSYEKTIDEIKEAMTKKIGFLEAKIAEREARVARIRESENITDADLISLLSQAANAANQRHQNMPMSYSLETRAGDPDPVRYIAAGVVSNLLEEKRLIEQETDSIKQMKRIVRNLRPITHHADDGTEYLQTSFTLRDDELDYLGF